MQSIENTFWLKQIQLAQCQLNLGNTVVQVIAKKR